MSLSTRISVSWLTCLFFSVAMGFSYAAVMSGYNDCRNSCIVWSSHCASNDRQFVADIFAYGVLVSFILSIVLPVIVYRRSEGIQLLHITASTDVPASQSNYISVGEVRCARFRRICSICSRQISVLSHKLLSAFIAHPIRYMSRFAVAALAFCLGTFAVGLVTAGDANDAVSQPTVSAETVFPSSYCKQFTFNWLELENEKFFGTMRHVEIFMDERAFSESNLRDLFEHLSRANPQPANLTVVVHTDWSQFQNPRPNCPAVACGECNNEPARCDHLQAIYWRRGGKEFFDYSPRINVDHSKFTTIEMTPAINPVLK